jgi:hypothetical protein
MLDPNKIYFPEAESMPSLAMAFMRMMFAHAEFEEHVRDLQDTIMKTPPKRPHVFARLLRLLSRGFKIGGGLGNARQRPKRMAKLIKERPGLVENQEASEIGRILKAAIGPCDQRNLLAHGRWWRFDPKTSTITIRGERKGEPEWAEYTGPKISDIHFELNELVEDLYKVRREIERRRGDHDIPESDLSA